MPIEIRELIVHAEVGAKNRGESNTSPSAQPAKMDEKSVQEIVSRVVEILKSQNER